MTIAIDSNKIVYAAVGTLELGGTDLGPTTEDGVTIRSDQTYQKFYVDQQKTPVKNTLTERSYMIETTLAHSHIANLHKALNLGASALSVSSLTLDDSEAALATLKVIVPTTYSGSRTYLFDSVRVVSNLQITHKKKDNPALLPVTFEALYSTTSSRNGIVGDA